MQDNRTNMFGGPGSISALRSGVIVGMPVSNSTGHIPRRPDSGACSGLIAWKAGPSSGKTGRGNSA